MEFLQRILFPVLVVALASHAMAANLADVPASPGSNLSPNLKPLTPIAGTNLVLNIPYKMHDHTRPGCYVIWFWETYQDWKDKHRGLSVVCNKNDQQWYNTEDASFIFERTEGEESMEPYNGTVRVKNLATHLVVETWKSAGTWWVGLGGYNANPSEDMWYIRSDPSNINNVQLAVQDWYLYKHAYANHRAFLAVAYQHIDGYPYSFVPVIDLEARMYDFVFDKPLDGEVALHSSKKGMIDAYEINNGSPGVLSRTITVSEKVTNEFSWGFSESLKIFAKVKGKAGIPYLAESEVEAGFELTVTATQNWKSSVEKLFSMSYAVNVPANSNVKISAWYDLVKDISLDYTSKIEITGHLSRITDFDDVVVDTSASGEMIRKQLEYTKFDGEIVEIKENSVIAKIKGTMVASVGVKGQLNVDGKTMVVQVVPR